MFFSSVKEMLLPLGCRSESKLLDFSTHSADYNQILWIILHLHAVWSFQSY